MPSSPLAVFNFSKQGESTESRGTGSCFIVAEKGLPYKLLILSFRALRC